MEYCYEFNGEYHEAFVSIDQLLDDHADRIICETLGGLENKKFTVVIREVVRHDYSEIASKLIASFGDMISEEIYDLTDGDNEVAINAHRLHEDVECILEHELGNYYKVGDVCYIYEQTFKKDIDTSLNWEWVHENREIK